MHGIVFKHGTQVKLKVKVVPLHASGDTEGSMGVVLLMLNLSARWRCVVHTMLLRLHPHERAPVPIVEQGGWASGPVWTGMEKTSVPLVFEPWTVQTVASCCSHYTVFDCAPSQEV